MNTQEISIYVKIEYQHKKNVIFPSMRLSHISLDREIKKKKKKKKPETRDHVSEKLSSLFAFFQLQFGLLLHTHHSNYSDVLLLLFFVLYLDI